MNELELVAKALTEKKKLVAMLAPSFPIAFNYPAIIGMLKKLGFDRVVEVSVGAKKTNEQLLQLLKNNPDKKYITSPCPTVVRMIRKQMPQYEKYLAYEVDSPMVATAKICKERYPDHQPVFIGPCLVKKLEANEDYPELNILVITYADLSQILTRFNIKEETGANSDFDIAEPGLTRIYPIDGGLSHSSGVSKSFQADQVKAVSGWKNCMEAIKDFDTNPKIRLLDILFCEGGCIGGPGIKSTLTTEERKQKILDYRAANA
jgi:iron only hydrogenase large subunit-like protein